MFINLPKKCVALIFFSRFANRFTGSLFMYRCGPVLIILCLTSEMTGSCRSYRKYALYIKYIIDQYWYIYILYRPHCQLNHCLLKCCCPHLLIWTLHTAIASINTYYYNMHRSPQRASHSILIYNMHKSI